MLTGELRSQIDTIWNTFWTGGISNPLEVIEQITYLLFLRRLDELETLEERKSARLNRPMERRYFPEDPPKKEAADKAEGEDKTPPKRPYADFRWTNFKHFEAREMYFVVADHVFPFLRILGGDDST